MTGEPEKAGPRFIFITGGVASSLGKGLASAALASLLQSRGFSVRIRKFDPYLNVDPGTMSPYQHGEVYVTDDGAETDLDLGHYERYTEISSRRSDSVSTGQIYSEVIRRERAGEYLGATVQVIPHVTDMIKEFMARDLDGEDFVLVEIGGTVGDIEGLPFLEAIRQMRLQLGVARTMFVHLTLVPYIPSAGELKTKPSQHSVRELQNLGIQPDILLARCDREIPEDAKRKMALFCNIQEPRVIPALDVDTIYRTPISYHEAGFDDQVLAYYGLIAPPPVLDEWAEIVDRVTTPEGEVRIAVVGKYTNLLDAYKSLIEALNHGGIANRVKVALDWVESESVEDGTAAETLAGVAGILVPGGFGERGSEGKIAAIKYAREHNVPFFGICFGMQMAVVEAARNLLGLEGANSSEFGPCEDSVVGLLTEWVVGNEIEQRKADGDLGGTMRLGSFDAALAKGSLISSVYGDATEIKERHRHRYEVNIGYRDRLEEAGLVFSGLSPDGQLPEIVELPDHRWFVGVQFHPELKSRPRAPHPLFTSFVAAAVQQSRLV
jgi:CTP synthase